MQYSPHLLEPYKAIVWLQNTWNVKHNTVSTSDATVVALQQLKTNAIHLFFVSEVARELEVRQFTVRNLLHPV